MDDGVLVAIAPTNIPKQLFVPEPKRGIAYQLAMCVKFVSFVTFQQ